MTNKLTWKDWGLVLTLVVNVATFLIRSDVRALVMSGWTWLYLLSAGIAITYVIDVYRRAQVWLQNYTQTIQDAQREHERWWNETVAGWERTRGAFGREVADKIEDAVRYKVNLVPFQAEGQARANGDLLLERKVDALSAKHDALVSRLSETFPAVGF